MKKLQFMDFKRLIIILAMVLLSAPTYAQRGKQSGAEDSGELFRWSLQTIISMYDSDHQNISLGTDFGVNLTSRLYLVSCFEKSVDLYSLDGVDSYSAVDITGGAVGYEVCRTERVTFDLKAMVGSTISKSELEYSLYDLSVLMVRKGETIKPFLGVGARYYDISTQSEATSLIL